MLNLIVLSSFITVLLFTYPIARNLAAKQNSILRVKKYINYEEIREEKRKSSKKEFRSGLSLLSRTMNKTIQIVMNSSDFNNTCAFVSLDWIDFL